MRRDKMIQLVSGHKRELERMGVKSIALFGSVARDEASADSDADILVEFAARPTFSRFMEVKFYLESLLGCRVDLVTAKALKPRLRDRVEREAIHVPGF
ncbi:MAG: nucleotidyltransferase family protein [Chloroflexota bacterium]|nr:nucleotidyltransferase family protein [Chloroflexota bacterium]